MRWILNSCFLLLTFFAFAQDETTLKDTTAVKIDSLYREDQFYVSFTYNRILEAPEGFDQQKFSVGISGGFVRDMPLNKRRNIAFATGLGFTYNNYFQNLTIEKFGDSKIYHISDYNDFDRNKFSNFLLDVPLEFRWRSSTAQTYRFWRVYSGLKFSYLLFDASVLKNALGKNKIKNNPDFNDFQYGVYLGAGFNTWNFYGYYGLNTLFKKGLQTTDGQNINIRALNFGIIFYIL
ncbi:PorT family protein [Flavobacterium sp. SE-1-e]|uniref:PorT family protein n=2 Tax=Flavobacterium agrisoli TaxID=2793066 RepID=A0A934UIV3_9FLAO|nr:PorT family protein [Flavobacterium agrisoli]